MVPWFYINGFKKSYPRVKGFFEALRRDESGLPIGAAGFCWGGRHVMLLAADASKIREKPLIDAGFAGHPSMVELPSDAENIKLPVAFAIGDKDAALPKEKAEQIKTVVEGKPAGQRGELQFYPDCGHGFCVRADTKFEEVAKQAAAAEDQCIEWFNKHLKT